MSGYAILSEVNMAYRGEFLGLDTAYVVSRIRRIGNFTYECDFMVLEDTTSFIDHDLGSVVFGKPFAEMTGLVYDKKDGMVAFEDNNEKLIFKMPHKMEIFKNINFTGVGLEVGSIRRIQGLDTAYWGFLGVGTMLDIFQNIHILYLEYGVLSISGYGVLSFIPLWSLVSAGTDTPYLP
ncbi:hypothetical protein Tco_1304735 [Tanacetum coccineum]